MSSLEYAHARLGARYGERPDEIAWRRIEHVRDFPAFLDATRASSLRGLTSGIGPVSTPHEIDTLLRDRWRALVTEVAGWMPEAWQPAMLWSAAVVDLAAVQHLARSGATLPWMRDDSILRDLCEREAGGFGAAPVGGPLAPLATAWAEPDRVGHAWRAEFWRRVPRGHGGDGTLLAELARILKIHLAAFHDGAVRDGWPLRRALQARLAGMYRRAVLDPAAAFIFLALAALDLERLRGELQRRAAFVGVPMLTEPGA